MSSEMEPSATGKATAYPEGALTERLRGLSMAASPTTTFTDPLDPYRGAAAVLVAFDPATLRPLAQSAPANDPLALLPELTPSPYLEQRSIFPWTLPVSTRKRALRKLNTQAQLRQALAANVRRPDTLLQRTMENAIHGKSFSLTNLNSDELRALAAVTEWLSETELGPSLPKADMVREESARRRDLDILHYLAGDVFTGRERELAMVDAHIVSNEPSVLFISGVGGAGKSALVAHALLAWQARSPVNQAVWVRIDLDSSAIQPEKPFTVVAETAQQLKRRQPEFSTILDDFIRDISVAGAHAYQTQTEMNTPAERQRSRLENIFLEILGLILRSPENRLVLWIDTFEEAQFLGAGVAATLMHLLWSLTQRAPGLRVIVSGRARLQQTQEDETEQLPKAALREWRLRHLPPEAAQSLLRKLVKKVPGAKKISDLQLRKAARTLGGNPLALRLGAAVLAKEGAACLDDLKGFRAQALQRWLYSRILAHLHELEEIRKLAMPGLIVRRITPEVIMNVLAEPCGLGPVNLEKAGYLFNALAAEITLLEKDNSDGSLRHRQDVRLLMLEGVQLAEEKVVREIDTQAVKFWNKRPGAIARAEEIYHRLRLQQSDEVLKKHWQEEAGPLLRGALAELPARSRQRLWLAERLNAVLETGELSHVSDAAWEKQTTLRAQRYLTQGDAAGALALLRQRQARLPGSRLYALEARAYLLLGQSSNALATVQHGIAASRYIGDYSVIVDLLLLQAFIYEREHDFSRAEKAVHEALVLAEQLNDPVLQLSVGVRRLRLDRARGGVRQVTLNEWLLALVRKVGPHVLVSNPALLRELAAELGAEAPDLLRNASSHFLEELLQPMSNTEILGMLEQKGLVSAGEVKKLQSAQSAELIKLARHRIEEALYSSGKLQFNVEPSGKLKLKPVVEMVRDLFRKSVDAILNKEYGTPVAPRNAAAARTADPFADQPDLRALLESVIEAAPVDLLSEIARFQLRIDLSRLKGTDLHEMASDFVERATRLGRVEEVVQQLSQASLPALTESVSILLNALTGTKK